MNTLKSYDPELIPVVRKPVFACYDNKKIKNWIADDFAEYVFDNSDSQNKVQFSTTFFNDSIIEYLEEIPKNYARVYLYGVFALFQERMKQ